MKKKTNKLSPLSELIQVLLSLQFDYKWFKTRNNFNLEKSIILRNSIEFGEDIKMIRQDLGVPRLNQEEDWVSVPISLGSDTKDIEDSSWLYGKGETFIGRFEQRVNNLLIKYELPKSFTEWVEHWVLYGKPKSYPHYYIELIQELANNREEVLRIPLTTGEKDFAKQVYSERLGIKRRPKKEISKTYHELVELLASSKNKKHPLRNIGLVSKIMKVGRPKKSESLPDETRNRKRNTKRVTYENVIPDIYSFNEESKLTPKILNTRLRKQRQRLRQRNPNTLNKLGN